MSCEAMPFKRGVLKWFDFKRGYGFIVPDDGGPDVFAALSLFNRSGLQPVDLMPLDYHQRQTVKGQRATDLRPLATTPADQGCAARRND
jgi:cold shock protein